MAGPTPDQLRQWEDDGYLVIENAVQGDELKQLQAAFDSWADAGKDEWLDRIEAGKSPSAFYDVSDAFRKEKVIMDLADHPSYYDLLQTFADGELLFLAPQVRTFPPGPISYLGWHPDVPHTNPLHIKVQIYVFDVAPGGGEFGFVPGSHKPDAGPYRRPHRPREMPGHKALPGKAGTAIIFNAYGWHTGIDNLSSVPRKSIILIYEKRTPERVDPKRFADIAEFCTTPERRILFGLEVP